MLLRRLLAWCLMSLALTLLGSEFMSALEVGHYYILNIGDLWQHYAPDSLTEASSLGHNPIFFWLWDPVAETLLKLPGWGPPVVLSLYYFMTSRTPERRALLQ